MPYKGNMNYYGNNKAIQSIAYFIVFLVFGIYICYALLSIVPCHIYNLTKRTIRAANFVMFYNLLIYRIACLYMILWSYYQFSKSKCFFVQLKSRKQRQGLFFELLAVNNIFIFN